MAKAGKWGDYNVCDSPGYLIENICEQVSKQHKVIPYTHCIRIQFSCSLSLSLSTYTSVYICLGVWLLYIRIEFYFVDAEKPN